MGVADIISVWGFSPPRRRRAERCITPEAVLLVGNGQGQVGKGHALLNQSLGAKHQIQRTIGGHCRQQALLPGPDAPGQKTDGHWTLHPVQRDGEQVVSVHLAGESIQQPGGGAEMLLGPAPRWEPSARPGTRRRWWTAGRPAPPPSCRLPDFPPATAGSSAARPGPCRRRSRRCSVNCAPGQLEGQRVQETPGHVNGRVDGDAHNFRLRIAPPGLHRQLQCQQFVEGQSRPGRLPNLFVIGVVRLEYGLTATASAPSRSRSGSVSSTPPSQFWIACQVRFRRAGIRSPSVRGYTGTMRPVWMAAPFRICGVGRWRVEHRLPRETPQAFR